MLQCSVSNFLELSAEYELSSSSLDTLRANTVPYMSNSHASLDWTLRACESRKKRYRSKLKIKYGTSSFWFLCLRWSLTLHVDCVKNTLITKNAHKLFMENWERLKWVWRLHVPWSERVWERSRSAPRVDTDSLNFLSALTPLLLLSSYIILLQGI